MAAVQEQLEGLPGYDILMGYWEEYAGEHFNTMDPYQDENGNKRKLPVEYTTKKEQKIWKKVQLSAWAHDKCFLGSCGVGMDCGLGLAPLVVLFFPVLGPLVMYGVHSRLIHVITNEMKLPPKVVAKMEANILLDLIITFPPLIGSFFGYLHACSTRNAGLAYSYFLFLAQQRQKNNVPTYIGKGAISENDHQFNSQPAYRTNVRAGNYGNPEPVKSGRFKKPPASQQNEIVVQNQQLLGFV